MTLENPNRQAALEERLRFETLIADLSSKFINLPAGQVDLEIEDALRRVCEYLELDLSALWEWSDQSPRYFTMTHLYRPLGGPAPPERVDAEEMFPWCLRQLLAGKVVSVSSMATLPPEAARDQAVWRHYGIKSILTFPLSAGGGQLMGALSFNTMREERVWPEEIILRLQLVSLVFANALARKVADQALRESEARLSLAADSAGAGLWVLDCRTQLFWGTDRALAIFGLDPGKLARWEHIEASIYTEDLELVRRNIERSLQDREPINVEYRIMLRDGRLRWVISHARHYFSSAGEPERLMGVSIDITERRRAEIEVQTLRHELTHSARVSLVGELSASMAHELNQPLTAILSNAQAAQRFLATDPPDLPEFREILKDIVQDTARARDVIRHLRALVKKGERESLRLDLNETIRQVVNLLHADIVGRNMKVVLDLAPAAAAVTGDKTQLQQVLINLLLNAFDAMKRNPVADRRVTVLTSLESPELVRVAVRDSGEGIPSEKLEAIFQPFFTTKSQGLGMGLSLSRSIVASHGGRLWAEKNASGGALFCFTLPRAGEMGKP